MRLRTAYRARFLTRLKYAGFRNGGFDEADRR